MKHQIDKEHSLVGYPLLATAHAHALALRGVAFACRLHLRDLTVRTPAARCHPAQFRAACLLARPRGLPLLNETETRRDSNGGASHEAHEQCHLALYKAGVYFGNTILAAD